MKDLSLGGVIVRFVCFFWIFFSISGSFVFFSVVVIIFGCIVGRSCKECCFRVELVFFVYEEEVVGIVLCGC